MYAINLYLKVFYGTRDTCLQFCGKPNLLDFIRVSSWLDTIVTAEDYVFVVGTNKEFIQLVYGICGQIKCKLFVCTSFQAIRQSDENYILFKRCVFIMPSFTKQEYNGTIIKKCLQVKMKILLCWR